MNDVSESVFVVQAQLVHDFQLGLSLHFLIDLI